MCQRAPALVQRGDCLFQLAQAEGGGDDIGQGDPATLEHGNPDHRPGSRRYRRPRSRSPEDSNVVS
ncbi:hypothetical protein D7207_14875 [Burkholderia cepacia]|nr:hypothetical protein [Burkholderia cepacia]MBA9943671.1 hypothetical protein [Burkholderia cepacia]MBA9973859.1 hypothetical protein [Burkholderia cepacia]MBA9992051.1 hypothetical protein [Burkholderia cepacia]MBB0003161.1 hypothetical protein [Burkholderia cepacia]